jgi:hypothetical protein
LTDERVNELAAAYKIQNYAVTYAAELAKGADVGRTYANQLLARISLNLDAYQVHLEPEAYLNLPVLAVALEQHASLMPFTCKTQEWVRHDTPPTELSCMSCPPLTRSDWEADTLMDPRVYSWLYMAPHGCARCNPLPNWARWPCPMIGSPRPPPYDGGDDTVGRREMVGNPLPMGSYAAYCVRPVDGLARTLVPQRTASPIARAKRRSDRTRPHCGPYRCVLV